MYRNFGGARWLGMFRFLVIRSISFVSVIKALIFMELPHLGQINGSNSKTFFISRAQLADDFTIGSGKGRGSCVERLSFSLSFAAPLVRDEYAPKNLVVCSHMSGMC